MIKFIITLRFKGKQYSFHDSFEAWDEERNAHYVAEYMYTEGNYGCDCNKSLFIGRHCNSLFPEMPCGRTIKLVSIREAGKRYACHTRQKQRMLIQRKQQKSIARRLGALGLVLAGAKE